MNRTYRLVWNRALHIFQVVSELARTSHRGHSPAVPGSTRVEQRRLNYMLAKAIVTVSGPLLASACLLPGLARATDHTAGTINIASTGIAANVTDPAIVVVGDGQTVTVDNGVSGTDSSTSNGGTAVSVEGAGHLIVTDQGNITGGSSSAAQGAGGNAVVVSAGTKVAIIENTGAITGGQGPGANGVGIAVAGAANITNSGTISGGSTGINNSTPTGGDGITISQSFLQSTIINSSGGIIQGGHGSTAGGDGVNASFSVLVDNDQGASIVGGTDDGDQNGGTGVSVQNGASVRNAGSISGASGAIAGIGLNARDAGSVDITATGLIQGGDGSGGAGGIGLNLGKISTSEFSPASGSNEGLIIGGKGGSSGVGGIGANLFWATLQNSGSVRGGDGGNDGQGGAGVVLNDAQVTMGGVTQHVGSSITNTGQIIGGTGGSGGAGGTGLIATGYATVDNLGSISNGAAGMGATTDGSLGHAIDFSGGSNKLILHSGSGIDGLVVSTSGVGTQATNGGDTLELQSDGTGFTFDASQVGSIGGDAQYQGFNALDKTGSGTLVLTGSSSTQAAWTIRSGVISIASDDSLGAISAGLTIDGGSLLATANLSSSRAVTVGDSGGTVDTGGNDIIWDGNVSGPGSLTKVSEGTLILNGQSSYTGGTTITGGTLEVGDIRHALATLGGNVQVNPNGALRGHGNVLGSVTNDGLVWPGASVGTLTIQGDFVQNASGALRIDVTPTAASQLLVHGSASLAGTLDLIYAPGTYSSSHFTLLQANNVSGQFDTIQSSGIPAGAVPQVSVTTSGVELAISPSRIISPENGSLFSNILMAANLSSQRTLDSVLDIAHGCGNAFATTTSMHCQGALWLQATGSAVSLDGRDGLNATAFVLQGGIAREWDTVSAGVEAGVDRINGSGKSGGNGDVQRVHAGLYASANTGPLVWSAATDLAQDDYHFDRATGVGFATSDPSGRTLSGGLQTAWPMHAGAWLLTPRLGVLYQHQGLDGFDERLNSTDPLAPAFSVNAGSNTHSSLQPFTAFAAMYGFQSSGIDYAMTLDVGYRHDLRTPVPSVDVTAQDGTPFALRGVAQGRGLGTAGIRLLANSGKSWTAFLDYQGQFAERLHDNALTFGFNKNF